MERGAAELTPTQCPDQPHRQGVTVELTPTQQPDQPHRQVGPTLSSMPCPVLQNSRPHSQPSAVCPVQSCRTRVHTGAAELTPTQFPDQQHRQGVTAELTPTQHPDQQHRHGGNNPQQCALSSSAELAPTQSALSSIPCPVLQNSRPHWLAPEVSAAVSV
jgi:hypothetical protein